MAADIQAFLAGSIASVKSKLPDKSRASHENSGA